MVVVVFVLCNWIGERVFGIDMNVGKDAVRLALEELFLAPFNTPK